MESKRTNIQNYRRFEFAIIRIVDWIGCSSSLWMSAVRCVRTNWICRQHHLFISVVYISACYLLFDEYTNDECCAHSRTTWCGKSPAQHNKTQHTLVIDITHSVSRFGQCDLCLLICLCLLSTYLYRSQYIHASLSLHQQHLMCALH